MQGIMTKFEADINQRVWQVVAAIPQGRVSTYGSIAQKAGIARAARRVGRALRMLPPGTRVPWHRVVNAQGRLSLPADSASHRTQRERLEKEGVTFRASGTINLDQYGW